MNEWELVEMIWFIIRILSFGKCFQDNAVIWLVLKFQYAVKYFFTHNCGSLDISSANSIDNFWFRWRYRLIRPGFALSVQALVMGLNLFLKHREWANFYLQHHSGYFSLYLYLGTLFPQICMSPQEKCCPRARWSFLCHLKLIIHSRKPRQCHF